MYYQSPIERSKLLQHNSMDESHNFMLNERKQAQNTTHNVFKLHEVVTGKTQTGSNLNVHQLANR